MPEPTKSGAKPSAPSFYSTAGQMAAGEGGKSNAPATEAGGQGEKIKNVKVLLEVFGKMDSLEQDQAGKDMIRQMSDLAKQYQQKLEGVGGEGKPAKTPTSDGAPGAGAPGGAGGPGGGPEAGAVPA